MPNYSPSRRVFSSTKKDIKEIPFQELFEIYMTTYKELADVRQAELDEEYEAEIRELEISYNQQHEAPYEGNFSDQITRPKAQIDAKLVQQRTTDAIKTNFLAKYSFPLHVDWIMPQIITLLGNMPTKLLKGKISGKHFLENFDTPWLRGIYYLAKINTKSAYLHLQYKAPAKEYGALVPLILYAQRLVKGTPYSAWDRDELHYVVHQDLVEAMLLEPHSFSKTEILQFRDEGLTVKSGSSQGTKKSALTTHKLTGVKEVNWNLVPPLAQVMLAQIWMAHPDAKTKYMVLDPYNWDKMPAALVTSEVLKATIIPDTVQSDVHWLL